MCIVESAKIVINAKNSNGDNDIYANDFLIIRVPKPKKFIKMIKIEDDRGYEYEFEVSEENIMIKIKNISYQELTMYYEVSENPILLQLKEYISC